MAKKSKYRETMEERLKYLLDDESISETCIQRNHTVREVVEELIEDSEIYGFDEQLLRYTDRHPDATDIDLFEYTFYLYPGVEIVPDEEWNGNEDDIEYEDDDDDDDDGE